MWIVACSSVAKRTHSRPAHCWHLGLNAPPCTPPLWSCTGPEVVGARTSRATAPARLTDIHAATPCPRHPSPLPALTQDHLYKGGKLALVLSYHAPRFFTTYDATDDVGAVTLLHKIDNFFMQAMHFSYQLGTVTDSAPWRNEGYQLVVVQVAHNDTAATLKLCRWAHRRSECAGAWADV